MKRSWSAILLLGLLLASPAPSSAASSSLAAPPAFVVGSWWDARLTDLSTRDTFAVRLVVAAHETGLVEFAVAGDHIPPPALTFHLLPLAAVDDTTLAYDVHAVKFQPVQFPLAPGASWTTALGPVSLRAVVDRVEGPMAQISYRDAGNVRWAWATYDADIGFLRNLEFLGDARMDVLAAGTGFSCPSVSARDATTVFETLAPLVEEETASPVSPALGTAEVPDRFEHLAIQIHAGSPAGFADQRVFGPRGQFLETRVLPDDAVRDRAAHAVFEAPSGWWSLESTLVEGGYSSVVGIAFTEHAWPARVGGGPTEACTSMVAKSRTVLAFPGTARTPLQPFASSIMTQGVTAALVGLVGWLFARRRALLWGLVGYAKLERSEVLSHPARVRILDLVRARPGLMTQEIRRELELGWGTAVYHVTLLERHGLLAAIAWGRNRHWFDPSTSSPRTRALASVARRPPARRILSLVEAVPGIAQADLGRGLDLHHATIIFHARRLELLGLLERRRENGRIRYFSRDETPVRPSPSSPGAH